MAVRYVKDFEFPSAAGYSDSKPSKVTGQMLAKGGKVEKVMHEFGEGKLHSGSKKGPKVTNPKQAIAIALSEAGKAKKAKGGMAHEDVAADKSLIKSMVKPAALKKAMGGQAVQMAKSNAIEASMKGQKKTGYADGGMTGQQIPDDVMSRYSAAKAAPQGPLSRVTLADGRSAVGERQVVDPKFAPQMRSMGMEIGSLPAGAKSVPVAPRAPMIPQQGAPSGPRIGVGRSRSGKPNVGAIRAAMAKAATKSMPENAPEVMKKGGKVKC